MSSENPQPVEISQQEFAEYSTSFVKYCKQVDKLLKDPSRQVYRSALSPVRRTVNRTTIVEYPIFQIVSDVDQEVARTVRMAAGYDSDGIVYPLAGTDITAALAFATKPFTHIITIDKRDAFGIPASSSRRQSDALALDHIVTALPEKPYGFVVGSLGNLGLPVYAAELSLLGVDFNTLKVISRKVDESVAETVIEYTLPDGRRIRHTNFSRFSLLPDKPLDTFLAQELEEILYGLHRVIFLSKGAKVGPYIGVRPLSQNMRSGDIVVLSESDPTREYGDLTKNGIVLTNIKAPDVEQTLKTSRYTYGHYGYLPDLTSLGIYRVEW